ncbi:hypothetical protein BFS08_04285 [Gardnerella sp. KA00735]|nr:hypothetical protein BFS08_04285 [Gardnerella sp. KA00735]
MSIQYFKRKAGIFATLRLGKTSVPSIERIANLPNDGTQNPAYEFTTAATQVPTALTASALAFIWLGSDSSKGQATSWGYFQKSVYRISCFCSYLRRVMPTTCLKSMYEEQVLQ